MFTTTYYLLLPLPVVPVLTLAYKTRVLYQIQIYFYMSIKFTQQPAVSTRQAVCSGTLNFYRIIVSNHDTFSKNLSRKIGSTSGRKKHSRSQEGSSIFAMYFFPFADSVRQMAHITSNYHVQFAIVFCSCTLYVLPHLSTYPEVMYF